MTVQEILTLFDNLRRERLPNNQAAILLWLSENEDGEQKDMVKPLDMSSNVICQAMRILLAEKFVEQTPLRSGGFNRKIHNLTPLGESVVKALMRE